MHRSALANDFGDDTTALLQTGFMSDDEEDNKVVRPAWGSEKVRLELG